MICERGLNLNNIRYSNNFLTRLTGNRMLVFEIQDLSDTVIEGNYTTIIKEYY